MKKIILILSVFISLIGYSQVGVNPVNVWNLNGNTFATSANWLGTKNAQSLVFKTDNVDRFTISSTGAISALGNIAITNTVTNTPVLSLTSGTNLAFLLHDGTSFALGTDNAIPTEIYYNNLLKIKLNDNQFRFSDGVNYFFGTTIGTKFGESTSQKLAFFNSTPIIQPTATTDILTVLSNLGLRASGTAAPLTSSGSFVLSSAANVISVRNLKGTGTAVTTTTGSAIGTNGTCTVTTNSTNSAGLLTVTTGTAATGISGTVTAVNFANAFGVAPNVILTPANSSAALLSGATSPFVNGLGTSTTQFFIVSGTTALTASTVYRYYYHVIE